MPNATLSETIGHAAALALAAAYEAALRVLTKDRWEQMPSTSTRLALVDAMLAEGRSNGFVSQRLTSAGLAAVARPAT